MTLAGAEALGKKHHVCPPRGGVFLQDWARHKNQIIPGIKLYTLSVPTSVRWVCTPKPYTCSA